MSITDTKLYSATWEAFSGVNLELAPGSLFSSCAFQSCVFTGSGNFQSCTFTDCDLTGLNVSTVTSSFLKSCKLPYTNPDTWYGIPTTTAFGGSGSSIIGELSKLVPALLTETASCPACMNLPDSCIATIVQHVNDTHRWSRENIADWLEELNVDLTIKPKGKVNA